MDLGFLAPWSSTAHQSKSLWLWHWPGWLLLTLNSHSIYVFFFNLILSTLNSSLELTGTESAEAAPQRESLEKDSQFGYRVNSLTHQNQTLGFSLPLSPSLRCCGASQECQECCPS